MVVSVLVTMNVFQVLALVLNAYHHVQAHRRLDTIVTTVSVPAIQNVLPLSVILPAINVPLHVLKQQLMAFIKMAVSVVPMRNANQTSAPLTLVFLHVL
jgi:hypothetical protein